jgi:hypothetical protein
MILHCADVDRLKTGLSRLLVAWLLIAYSWMAIAFGSVQWVCIGAGL